MLTTILNLIRSLMSSRLDRIIARKRELMGQGYSREEAANIACREIK